MSYGIMNLRVATTLQEYIDIVSEVKQTIKIPWFRGLNSSSYCLTPSLFRENSVIGPEHSGLHSNGNFYRKSDAVMKSDLSAIDKFIEYYQIYYPEKCKDYNLIDYLYIMQHYDIPTRLLDFSTDEFIALYFAVSTTQVRQGDQGDVNKEIEDFNDNDGDSELGASVHIIDPAFIKKQAHLET